MKSIPSDLNTNKIHSLLTRVHIDISTKKIIIVKYFRLINKHVTHFFQSCYMFSRYILYSLSENLKIYLYTCY